MTLDPRWVEAIHTKLMLTYGTRFAAMYAGQEPAAVKAHWGHELSGVSAEGIKHALNNLPLDHPPNVLQFRAICTTRRVDEPLALPPRDAGRMSPQVAAKLRETMLGMRNAHGDRKAWANRLKVREMAGERLTAYQRSAWRAALREYAALGGDEE